MDDNARDQESAVHEGGGAPSFARRLLHRWLVEYNPLYLLSASLVLGGMILLSRGLASEGSIHGQLCVAAIAEVYAIALIGGSALLTRIGHRRPAVMLAVLTVLYQCDLTLHTDACANLGDVGVYGSVGWLVLFVAKLYALAWAMKVRLSRTAVAIAALAGFGLADLPYLLDGLHPRLQSAVVAIWLCGLVSLYRPGLVTSRIELDAWGETVLRRALRVSWMLGGFLVVLHVLFSSTHTPLQLSTIAVVVPLVATRWMSTEKRVWALVTSTLVVVALMLPGAFAVAALVAAVGLATRANEVTRTLGALDARRVVEGGAPLAAPYRMTGSDEPALVVDLDQLAADGRAMRLRLLAGAAFAVYLSLWTRSWSDGYWPAHQLALDLLLLGVAVGAAWKLRLRATLVPVAFTWGHFVIVSHVIPAPQSTLQWGGVAVGLGFVLLTASLATSWFLRDAQGQRASTPRPPTYRRQ